MSFKGDHKIEFDIEKGKVFPVIAKIDGVYAGCYETISEARKLIGLLLKAKKEKRVRL